MTPARQQLKSIKNYKHSHVPINSTYKTYKCLQLYKAQGGLASSWHIWPFPIFQQLVYIYIKITLMQMQTHKRTLQFSKYIHWLIKPVLWQEILTKIWPTQIIHSKILTVFVFCTLTCPSTKMREMQVPKFFIYKSSNYRSPWILWL